MGARVIKNHFPFKETPPESSGKQLVVSLPWFFRFYDMAKILLAECILRMWSIAVGLAHKP